MALTGLGFIAFPEQVFPASHKHESEVLTATEILASKVVSLGAKSAPSALLLVHAGKA